MLEIRRYQPADNPAVWELHHRALGPTGAYFRDGIWDADLNDIPNHYLQNGGEFLVGMLDGKIVAMGAFRKKSTTLAEIKRMRVLPEYQRRGFGQAILNQLEDKSNPARLYGAMPSYHHAANCRPKNIREKRVHRQRPGAAAAV